MVRRGGAAPLLSWGADYESQCERKIRIEAQSDCCGERYSGRNYFAAHSLGNMLVSSAIQDWNLPHEKYFMLNAAVAAEAYDPTAITTDNAKARLTCPEWIEIDDSRRATHWFEHPSFAGNDARRTLTWKNRFSDVTKTVNYYSSEEEVLCCGQGEHIDPLGREYAWYNQERLKGNMIPGSGRNEGGWGFNPKYLVPHQTVAGEPGVIVTEWLPPTAYAVSQITDDARTSPVFLPFDDETLHTTNLIESISRAMHSQLLADAIPAESLPVGSSVVPRWSVSLDIHEDDGGARVVQNKNMALEFKDSANKNIYGGVSDVRS